MKLEFSGHLFEKYSNMKFHENPSNRGRVTASRQTDRHDLMIDLRKVSNALTVHPEIAVGQFVILQLKSSLKVDWLPSIRN